MKHRILLATVAAVLAAPLAGQAALLEERPPGTSKAAADERAAKTESKQERRRAQQARMAELKRATRQCVALKKQLGARDFAAAYPTLRACLKARVAAEREHRAEAEADCRAKLGKRAHPKRIAACAGKAAAHDSAEERAAVVGAAKACGEELASDPAAFREDYGTGHTLANAFGKCVAAKASGSGDEDAGDEQPAEDEESAEDEPGYGEPGEAEEGEHEDDEFEQEDEDGEDA